MDLKSLFIYILAVKNNFWIFAQKFFAILILMALLSTQIFAQQPTNQNVTDWNNVVNAKNSGEVVVKKKDGKTIRGSFGDSTSDSLSIIVTKKGFFTSKQILITIPKDEIREVRAKISMETAMLIGALIGSGGGLATGIGIESQSESNEDKGVISITFTFLGGLVGAGVGGTVQALKKGKLIYQSN